MRNDYIHITMVIDKSGSMYGSKEDVVGGFKKLIDEQKENKDGKVTVSLYTFNDNVTEDFVGKDVNEVTKLNYHPMGNTAMNDGIGTAIDKTGKWLADMNEEDRPGKVLLAVFTDGMENSSREYSLESVKEKINHQEKKYNWSVVYMGTDITTTKAADELGIKMRTYGSRDMLSNNYDILGHSVSAYRCMAKKGLSNVEAMATMDCVMDEELTRNTASFEQLIGSKIQ